MCLHCNFKDLRNNHDIFSFSSKVRLFIIWCVGRWLTNIWRVFRCWGGANIHCTISYIKQAILDSQVKGRRLGGSPLWLACPSSFVQWDDAFFHLLPFYRPIYLRTFCSLLGETVWAETPRIYLIMVFSFVPRIINKAILKGQMLN